MSKKEKQGSKIHEVSIKGQTSKTFTEEISEIIEEVTEDKTDKKKEKGEQPVWIDEEKFSIGKNEYRILKDYREGFQLEKFGERFSEILNRYDYIVGDWGYEQLRLKGFFKKQNTKVPIEQRISSLEDYLYEFCNFGCAYFVVERIGGGTVKQQNRNQNKRKYSRKGTPHSQEKKGAVVSKQTVKKQGIIKKRRETITKKTETTTTSIEKQSNDRKFTTRKKDN